MAGVKPGLRVLDLSCGAGSQTLRAASRVGPTGSVVATDISANMLEYVREHARRGAFDNITTVECAAEDLDPAQGPYDAAISRLGLMLFSSPSAALQAVQRVLKPKARFAALVFTAPANHPFAWLPMQILLRHAGKQPPTSGQPGIFALGGSGVLERLLRDSGLIDVRTRLVRASLRLANASVALQMLPVERSGSMSDAVRLRSFSPSSSALHLGRSASASCRSTSGPDAVAIHCTRAAKRQGLSATRRASGTPSCGTPLDRTR